MNNSTDDGNDPTDPMTDDSFYLATAILLCPFVLIPLSIIFTRLVKYIWKIYQAKKYGYDDDLLVDPLAELGLKVRRGYDNTADVRKLRKEQIRIEQERIKKRESDERRAVINSQVLYPTDVEMKPFGFKNPLHAAGEYIDELRRKTTQTWFERVSPNAVRRWVNMSKYARLWMIFQVFCTGLSIINYVSLTYLADREDRDERKLIKNLDILYASVFLLDYCLSFYVAEDRLLFYCNSMSLIDLMSIVSPFVYLFVASPTKYVWFIGFVRIFRATRILRTYRLLSFTQSEQDRELTIFVLNFLNFIFFSASVINATEALNFSNSPPSLKRWHDSLYYIMVTFSTIGFGDLTPTSTMSRVVVMVLIVLVIVYVPYQTGKILEIYNSMSRYQRAQHSASSKNPHIILGGSITYSSIIDFCREFFVADDISSVVILNSEEPTLEIRRLLNHPFYRSRLSYLRGDVMSLLDLKRAQASNATAYFLLSSDSPMSYLESISDCDTQVLMSALFAKSTFPGLPIFAQVNDDRSQDFAAHCGIDRLVCINEIKSSLFASNCLCPGIQTMILNLIHSYRYVEPENNREFWTQEYQCGLANQIQSFKIPNGLVGLRFGDAIREIYETYNTMIFALVSVNAGFNGNKIRFGLDMCYRMKVDDIAFCIGDGGDELAMKIALHFRDTSRREDIEHREMDYDLQHALPDLTPFLTTPDSTSDMEGMEQIPIGKTPLPISAHIIVSGHLSSRILLNFIKTIRIGAPNSKENQICGSMHKDSPIVCILKSIPVRGDADGDFDEILDFHSVFIIKGNCIEKSILVEASISTCNRIVVFAKERGDGKTTTSISDSQSIFLEWPKVKFLVELVDGSNVKYFSSKLIEWDNNNMRVQSVLNNYALGINDRVQLTRNLRVEGIQNNMIFNRLIRFVTTENDLPKGKGVRSVKEQTILKSNDGRKYEQIEPMNHIEEVPLTEAYLRRALEEAELNESGLSPYPVYHFDRYFAAGMIASTSFMQSLLCQSYFRPYIIDIVKGLIENVCHIPVIDSLAGKSYVEVVTACIARGYIPLGIYRNGSVRDLNIEDSLPYVYTNCRHGDVVNKLDLIFAIRT